MKNWIGANRNAIFSRLFGNNIARARERVAAAMIFLHVTPNILTTMGLFCSLTAAVFLAQGAGDDIGSSNVPGKSWYGVWGAIIIIFGCAFDILDGAVARNSGTSTKCGAFLDSTLDRFADAAVLIGILMYYLTHPQQPYHRLLVVFTVVALVNSEFISYIKARAENFIPSCPVGYWQRGERLAGVLIGLFCGHINTVMVMLAILPAFTVLRRLLFSFRQIRRQENNLPLLDPKNLTGWRKYLLWRYRRGTVPYDFVTAVNISLILFLDAQKILVWIFEGQ